MSQSWANGSTRQYRRIRAAVLHRDALAGYHCRAHQDGWCNRKPGTHTCTRTPNEAHHTHGRALTGDNPDFMVSACKPCNLHIGDPTTGTQPIHTDPADI
jgi:hypothetical protein